MKRTNKLFYFYALFVFCYLAQGQNTKIEGDLRKWHKITLTFEGQELSEDDAFNPFLNYRLNVTFKNGDLTYVVPGFYAADGNASESSSTKGKIWKVRFRPDKTGKWEYRVSFRKGVNIAVNDSIEAGEPISFNGANGSFDVADVESGSSTPESKGRIKYTGERYLRYAETNEAFLKGGADSPEDFLGYYEFDQTPASHKYSPHAKDWKLGDPVWQKNKGKNIIGALNYLASKGMNAVYFLTMNVQGDGKDVWPWIHENERYRFDCSKLDQWEVVFDHMDKLGLMLHIVLQETENELLLDIGQLGVQRKLYLRELIARFSHHLGVTWNLGEENGPVHWSPKGQDDNDRKAMMEYIKLNDPYQNFVALHTHSVPEEQDQILLPLLGNRNLDGPSIQIHDPNLVHETTKKWIRESQKTDKIWVVNLDEIGPADVGAKPDADDPTHDEVRGPVLWGNLMAGGAGVEWYFGYKFAHMDLNCEDWRSRDALWDQTKIALDFFHSYLPFSEMHNADNLTKNDDDFVFAKNREIYAIYIPEVRKTEIDLLDLNETYTVSWFNPRTGGKLQKGTKRQIKGGKGIDIGLPPNKEGDWVALLKRKKVLKKENTLKPEVVTLDALGDFEVDQNNEGPSFYRDELNGVLAIDASNENNREDYAVAHTVFRGEEGLYKASFISMAENDGESAYIIRLNGTILDTIVNPEVNENFKGVEHVLGKVFLYKYDVIQIESKVMTNGKIPENDGTAWSRGRWSALKLVPNNFSLKELLKDRSPFVEENGFLEVEAESFHFKTNNGTKRDWVIQSRDMDDKEVSGHARTASMGAYIEALPDTRVTHDDALFHGENFFPIAGIGGVVSYKIRINNPGKYYVWASAFSSGSEDNGVHVGIDEKWPESGSRMQWCEGKDRWTWSSAQRLLDNHCGTPNTIFLNFESAGEYIVSFSMREDGFEMDKWIITTDNSFNPE
ncbi:DUF5060 domain-containing protein [Maribacter luteus]|uniref:DUF5060 domain-containing protein n=1 Tax=Maribacter luteus TaxID=2594478 RepID=A0A6I2MTQ5_9FLAO|nr:DUF5060 domain-containing protein [Maribacter luteus]MRX65870.1 DUF5060 domain-containing protein [Maribacter luteus]